VPDNLPILIVAVALVGFWAGRWAQRLSWKLNRPRAYRPGRRGADVLSFRKPADSTVPDPAEQLRVVMTAPFKKRRLLSKSEAKVLYATEKAIAGSGLTWRVMAQVSLGEVLACADPKAYAAISSKRVDLLVITSGGDPIAAIEYQGTGHYQGTASARDAVKKEALRRAGVRYIEVTPEHGPEDLVREIRRIAKPLQDARRGI